MCNRQYTASIDKFTTEAIKGQGPQNIHLIVTFNISTFEGSFACRTFVYVLIQTIKPINNDIMYVRTYVL